MKVVRMRPQLLCSLIVHECTSIVHIYLPVQILVVRLTSHRLHVHHDIPCSIRFSHTLAVLSPLSIQQIYLSDRDTIFELLMLPSYWHDVGQSLVLSGQSKVSQIQLT